MDIKENRQVDPLRKSPQTSRQGLFNSDDNNQNQIERRDNKPF